MSNDSGDTVEAAGGCLGLLLGIFLVVPLIILLAWNVGLVPIVAAAGGSVTGINYWAALGATFVYLLLRGIFAAGK